MIFLVYSTEFSRDAESDTPGAIDINGSKKLIEFDTYNSHDQSGDNKAVRFGWSSCHSSSFIPCRDDNLDVLGELRATETDPDESPDAEEIPMPKFKAVTSTGTYNKNIIIDFYCLNFLIGFNVAPNYDLYADLDDDALQATFIGKTIRAVAIGESVLEAAKPTLHNLFHHFNSGVSFRYHC